MVKNRLITPEGTKDYLFEEAATRKNIEEKLKALFLHRGFFEVITPGLEFLDVFSVKGHGIPVEYMYKLSDSKGRLMVLRPDSTMPIARLCATRLKGAKLPLRLFYNQPVYSTTRSMSGKSEEIFQTGIELIGNPSLKADLEILTTAIQSLIELRRENFRIEIGHIGIFNTLINALKISDEDKEQIRLFIESKNYPGLNDMLDKMGDGKEISIIKQLPRMFGGEEVFKKASDLIDDEQALGILSYLKSIYKNLEALGLGDKITVDLGIVNRTDYYTGIVFKGYVEGVGESVLSGGRYDTLLSQFGEDVGAIGFAINTDAIAKAELIENKPLIKPSDLIVFSKDGFEMKGIEYLSNLSKSGLFAEYSIFEDIDETIGYAKEKGIKRIDVVSETIETISL